MYVLSMFLIQILLNYIYTVLYYILYKLNTPFKKVGVSPSPTNQTLPGREYLSFSRPWRVWLVTSRLGGRENRYLFLHCSNIFGVLGGRWTIVTIAMMAAAAVRIAGVRTRIVAVMLILTIPILMIACRQVND
jgi:hypothetical protein